MYPPHHDGRWTTLKRSYPGLIVPTCGPPSTTSGVAAPTAWQVAQENALKGLVDKAESEKNRSPESRAETSRWQPTVNETTSSGANNDFTEQWRTSTAGAGYRVLH